MVALTDAFAAENFDCAPTEAHGQPWLRLGWGSMDVRFFLKGALLDKGFGDAVSSRKVLTPLLGELLPMVAPRQVHGVRILDATLENTRGASTPVEGDGVLLDAREALRTGAGLEAPGLEAPGLEALGLEASLRFADCAPVVILPSREGGKAENCDAWALLLHSGYKGTVQNIVKAGLEKVRDRYGAEAAHWARAWVGPCVGGENYPRDRDEWTLRGLQSFHKENVKSGGERGEKVFFDIAGELECQLKNAGIREERIFLARIDTFARPDLCYSYRRGDRELRMFLWARVSEPATGK
jgi:copper oxidase (laccase) domain-containing protein